MYPLFCPQKYPLHRLPILRSARWSSTLSPKVILHHAINFPALCGANLVTYPPEYVGMKPSNHTEWYVGSSKIGTDLKDLILVSTVIVFTGWNDVIRRKHATRRRSWTLLDPGILYAAPLPHDDTAREVYSGLYRVYKCFTFFLVPCQGSSDNLTKLSSLGVNFRFWGVDLTE